MITDGTYSSCQYSRREIPPAWPCDTTAARRILETKGWRDTDGDGVLDRDGQDFQFLTIVWPRRERAGIFVQDQLARIGTHMDVQMLDYSATVERFNAGDFAAIIPRLPQLDFRIGGPNSPSDYRNARVQELVTSIQEAFDQDEVERMYRELSDIYTLASRSSDPAHRLHALTHQLHVTFGHQ